MLARLLPTQLQGMATRGKCHRSMHLMALQAKPRCLHARQLMLIAGPVQTIAENPF